MIKKDTRIVACYIVKNEAKDLQKSLESVKNSVDDIVVTDTGSVDNTVEVALKYNAKILRFEWRDDFAAARNFTLDNIEGDWAVFLDADEYFSLETFADLRSVIERQDDKTNVVLTNRTDMDENGGVLLSLYVPRIFRLNRNLRYIGAIHEELRQNGELVAGVKAVRPAELTVIHTGYAGARGELKAKRNLEILLKEFKSESEPERLYGYIAEAYDGINDRENAVKYAYLDILRGRQPITYASRSFRILMARLAEKPADNEERIRIARLATRDFSEVPEFYAEYAEALAAGAYYGEAVEAMDKALSLGVGYRGIEPSVFNVEMGKIWLQRRELWKNKI